MHVAKSVIHWVNWIQTCLDASSIISTSIFQYDLILIAKYISCKVVDNVKIVANNFNEGQNTTSAVINQHHFMKGVEIALQINAVSWQQIL